MFEIDTDVAFDTSKKSRKSKIMEMPFDNLQIGESFHVPSDTAHGSPSKAMSAKLSAWCGLAAKRTGKRFSLRTVGKEDPRGAGLRIWRIEGKEAATAVADTLFSAAPATAPAKASTRAKRAAEPRVIPTPNRRQRKAEEARAH